MPTSWFQICWVSWAYTFSVFVMAMGWMGIMWVRILKKCCQGIWKSNYYRINYLKTMKKSRKCMIGYLRSLIRLLIWFMMIWIIRSMIRSLVEVHALLSCLIEILFILLMLEIPGLFCIVLIRMQLDLKLRRWVKIINRVCLWRRKGF